MTMLFSIRFGAFRRNWTAFLAIAVAFMAFGARADSTNAWSDAEIQGRALAAKIYWSRPETNATQTGVLRMRAPSAKERVVPARIDIVLTPTNWQTVYFAGSNMVNSGGARIIHAGGQPNLYFANVNPAPGAQGSLKENQLMSPLTPGSDYWLCDLGLEFFHWPRQKIVKKEFHRQCPCAVLESTNPDPSTNGYSRVVSWIDENSLGIVEAYAYDARGNKLKNFYPKNLEKVNGQYQVTTMVMENLQTGSRSTFDFDVNQ